jgi:hypothetical protein
MAFSHPWRANKKRVALLADKVRGGQFVNARAIDRRIEGEVEVVQRADLAEVGSFLAPGDCALLSHVEFVLENDFQELMVWESAGFSFLEAQLERVKQSREAQSLRVFFEGVVGHSWVDGPS